MAGLFKQAYDKTATVAIHPYNPETFTDQNFFAASVTDGKLSFFFLF